jgi:hypothetical protein
MDQVRSLMAERANSAHHVGLHILAIRGTDTLF